MIQGDSPFKTVKVTNVPALELAVANAGYAANDKKADPEAYEKLAECCKVSDQ